LPDVPSWWAEPGRPGYFPDAWWGAAYPWTYVGHVRGAVRLADPILPEPRPFPGVMSVGAPLGWLDSLAITRGGQSAWEGFESGISSGRALSPPPRGSAGRARARADLLIAGGSSAYDANSLALARGDSLYWARLGVGTWNRGGVGALGVAGGHHYEGSASWSRGRHRLSGAFAHRGAAAALEVGAEQDAGGAGGHLDYALGFGAYELALRLGSAYDNHESFGSFLSYSRRDARERVALAEWSGAERPWSARMEVRDATVARVTQDSLPVEARQVSVWLALAGEGVRGPARVRLGVGVGRDDETQRTELAPSLVLELGKGPYAGRVFIERVMTPVWSDLADGQSPFLQSTWLGGVDLSAGGGPGLLVRGGWLMGRTRDRAVVSRYPLEELWLRSGFVADPEPWDFGLATLHGEWRMSPWRVAVEAYHLFREEHAIQPAVDPRRGGRGLLETSLRAFKADLGVRLRAEVEAMSGRETEFGPATGLPGYVSFGAAAMLTLADASLALRIRNLENEARPQTWQDPFTGQQALGPGTEFRIVFGWRLYN
jgi:hypothetical protein